MSLTTFSYLREILHHRVVRVETVAKLEAMKCKQKSFLTPYGRRATCTYTVPLEDRTVLTSHITR